MKRRKPVKENPGSLIAQARKALHEKIVNDYEVKEMTYAETAYINKVSVSTVLNVLQKVRAERKAAEAEAVQQAQG